MVNTRIRSLHLGDLHLGHDLNPTSKIIANLDSQIDDPILLEKLDFIFLNGDIWHRLLSSNSIEYKMSIQWLTKLLYLGVKHKIRIRSVHGTISHDRDQSSILDNIILEANIPIDYKYITDITIEHIDDLNMNILYVPDNYGDSSLDAKHRVEYLLNENKLTKVDMCMMHGHFAYQIRGYESKHSHDINFYSSIVDYAVIINHVHTMSINGKIIAPGSPDRLAHGEEEDKGMIYTDIKPNGTIDYIFMVNKNSMPFITYVVEKDDILIISKAIKNIYVKHNRYINIRLRYPVTYTGYTGHIKELSTMYSDIRFTDIKDKDKKSNDIDIATTIEIPEVIEIREDNIKSLLTVEIDFGKLPKDLNKEVLKIIEGI